MSRVEITEVDLDGNRAVNHLFTVFYRHWGHDATIGYIFARDVIDACNRILASLRDVHEGWFPKVSIWPDAAETAMEIEEWGSSWHIMPAEISKRGIVGLIIPTHQYERAPTNSAPVCCSVCVDKPPKEENK